MTISSSIEDDANCIVAENLSKRCFICDTTESESFVSLYDTVSTHSKTLIFDFVWKFLDNQPSKRDDSVDAANSDWSLICAMCLNKINQYDLACETAAKFENELRNVLSETETRYSNEQSVADSRQTDSQYENDVLRDETACRTHIVVNVDPIELSDEHTGYFKS